MGARLVIAPAAITQGSSDVVIARALAIEASALLRDLCATGNCADVDLARRGDAEANTLILGRLHALRHDDFILSEEAADDPARCAARRVWIVDPLDGTREFAARMADWAVHIGLAVNGVAVLGAVALPASGRVFATDDPPPAFAALPDRPRMVVSRTRLPTFATKVAAALGADLVPMGSAGVKAMAVVDGRAEIYLHAGGQYEWDNCAPVAIARAAGLHASRIDGAPLVYNRRDPLLPDLLICRRELAGAVLAAVAAAQT